MTQKALIMKNKNLQAGIVEVDITPPVGYWMGGYGARKEPSKMVHDPLSMQIMSLYDGEKRVIIVSADLISFSDKFCEKVKKEVSGKTGFSESEVFLFASHTHTGPLINENISYLPDKKYFAGDYGTILIKKLTGGIKEAQLREEEVNVFHAEGKASIGINRRKKTEKGIEMQPNPEGAVDDSVQVLAFRNQAGTLAAIIFKACCHPNILSAIYEISADFPGAARSELEKVYPGVPAMFINGCCGDVRPAVMRNGKFIKGTFNDVDSMGKMLAGEVIKCVEKSEPLKNFSLKSKLVKHCLEFDDNLIPKNRKHLSNLVKYYKQKEFEFHEYIEKWENDIGEKIDAGEKFAKGVDANIMILSIGDFSLVALPGEVMVECGLKIRNRAKGKVTVAAYANEDIGYVPTRQAIKDGGYEASAFIFEENPAPYSLDIEEKLIKKVLNSRI